MKIPKLKCFIIKSVIINDSQLNYLKWILNNVNYIEKLKIRLDIKKSVEENFIVNRNIIYEYFLPDISRNLVNFDFYIASKCKSLSSNDIHRIINSFKTDRFFVNHIFTNVQCVFDPVMSYQYLSSTRIINPKRFDGMIDLPTIFDWEHPKYIQIDLCPSTSLFLKQINTIFPYRIHIKFNMGRHKPISNLEFSLFLQSLLNTEQNKLINIHFQYVTRLDFGSCFYRNSAHHDKCIDKNKLRAEVLAYLISMPIQLIYLRMEQYEWLLHLVEYASDKLRKNALSTVRHVEFCLTSCYYGSNESIQMGKNLIPFLSRYMPYLQILRLWRDDDFAWTPIPPSCWSRYLNSSNRRRRLALLIPEVIQQHVIVFEQNISELVQQLKHFVYLDIYGQTDREKIEPYRLMVQTRFPNSQVFIHISRFRFRL
ncbi:unnamed protein product [Adineta steineri]|uniref:Uncharacterized protein n=3 Tax=Adineta steineri TaxID=433720 RepID=A0A813SCE0_9BILA|nr:unnamed protein product [Adineta steineri]